MLPAAPPLRIPAGEGVDEALDESCLAAPVDDNDRRCLVHTNVLHDRTEAVHAANVIDEHLRAGLAAQGANRLGGRLVVEPTGVLDEDDLEEASNIEAARFSFAPRL